VRKLILFTILSAAALIGADGSVAKTPYESIDLSLDFLARAPGGVTLTSIAAYDRDDTDASTDVLVLSPDTPVPTVSGTAKITFRVQNGTDGRFYNILIRVTKTDTGEKLEGNILLHVVKKT
jgi:hypothetical protein